jgi:hypothetical protein
MIVQNQALRQLSIDQLIGLTTSLFSFNSFGNISLSNMEKSFGI